jgi:hypothetical protein
MGKEQNKRKEKMFRVRHGFTTKSKLFIVRQNKRSVGTSQIPVLSTSPSVPKILREVFLHASEILISQCPLLNFNHKNTILHQHHKTHTHKHCPHCCRRHHQRKTLLLTTPLLRPVPSQTVDASSTANAAAAANITAPDKPVTTLPQPTLQPPQTLPPPTHG